MTFSFAQQMAMSNGVAESMDIEALLKSRIIGALGVRKATTADDKQGTDYFVDHVRGLPLSVDIKARDIDPVVTYKSDDLALETWSVVGRKPGWSIDETKRTDFILWLFSPTRRFCLVSFPLLRMATKRFGPEWFKTYKHRRQDNYTYQSECMFVPRRVVLDAIESVSNGIADHPIPVGLP